jgi:hypothetical protein
MSTDICYGKVMSSTVTIWSFNGEKLLAKSDRFEVFEDLGQYPHGVLVVSIPPDRSLQIDQHLQSGNIHTLYAGPIRDPQPTDHPRIHTLMRTLAHAEELREYHKSMNAQKRINKRIGRYVGIVVLPEEYAVQVAC